MRHLLLAGVASLLGGIVEAQAPAAAAPPVATREIKNVVPSSAAVEQFTITVDSARTYYRLNTGGVWMYDRAANTTRKIIDAIVWDLALSPKKDAIAFTKLGDTPREQHVWVMPLSPATGLPSGKERKVSTRTGDVPSISPDGKLIAFARDDESGVGQSVVVAPIAGGAERVVAPTQPSGVSSIRWAPDGKRVYFGVNPPVPFTCAESCLTGARETRPSATIRRVSASGGSVETLATVGAPSPGLSPDGKYLVFGDSGSPRRLIVADADGKRLKAFSVATPQVPVGWTGSSTLLTLATGQVRRLRAVTLADAASRVVLESNDFIFIPSWTPDGRSVAVNRFGGNGCELSLMNVDGTPQRTISIAKAGGCAPVSWTNDQKSIVFIHFKGPNEPPALTNIDVASGQARVLRTLKDGNVQWTLDREVTLVSESVLDAGNPRRSIWQIDFMGNTKLLREIPNENGGVTLIDRNRALLARAVQREFRVISLATGETRTIATAPSGIVSRPFLSADREWMGYLAGVDNPSFSKLELVKLDGTERRSYNLPFFADPNGNVLITAGATGVVVTERRVPGQPTGVYFLNTATGASTKLLSAVGQPAELALSPDGRTLLYLVNELMPPVISALDIPTIR